MRSTWFHFSLWLWFASVALVSAQTPGVRVRVVPAGQSPATAPHQPVLALPATGDASATLVAEAFSFAPTGYTWTPVAPADVKTQHIHAAKSPVVLSSTSGAQITATFPARGIYQVNLTATDGAATATHQVWIHVWDRLDGLNPLQQIGRNPGLLPPASVRQLSPDPGSYQHPRLLFTDADWPELNAKSTASSEVVSALGRLQFALNNNFDKTTATVGALRAYANALVAWADGGFLDATYSSSVEPSRVFSERKQLGIDPRSHLPDALVVASYLVWVRNDPTLPPSSVSLADQARLRFLSQVAAAAARAELTRVRLGLATTATGASDMAVVYDLLYDWMTAAERTDLRDYLFTIGYGYYNTGGGGLERRTSAPASYVANGDFPNLVDPWILAALAIEGEEAAVTPSVVAANTPVAPAATGPAAWPSASPAAVWNLYRSIRWYSDFFVTPWGSPLNHHAYFEASSGMSAPALLALARRGQNAFVTTHLYQASFHAFNNYNPESPATPPVLWDHHDSMGFGNGIGGYAGRYLARYMYPDDALMDSVYPIYRREVSVDFYTALFHVDRPAKTFAQVAAAKGVELTRFDPFRGAAVTRNSWSENDLSLYFECRADVQGHMHAEANNFSLYALGRPWSTPPGYHVTINDASATVLIQDPALVSDPATEGYYGESPSAATITPTRSQFPTPPAKFLEATEDPAGRWALFAGDASSAYDYAYESGAPSQDTGRRIKDFYYGEVLSHMYADYDPSADTATLKLGNLAYNPVAYAYRTVFTARGSRPYVLVVDDIAADGVNPRNYRWNMPAFGRSAYNSLRLQAGATATDAILYHQPDAASGPRLLVRDFSEQSAVAQPAIFLDSRQNGDGQAQLDIGYDNNSGNYSYVQGNRLLITRQNVVSPKFKVLLFPHQSGETLPLTSWNVDQTVAAIDLRNGFTDRLTFDSTRADKRTRLAAYTRTLSGRAAPTINLPASLIVPASPDTLAFTGQPGAVVNFSVTATDDIGATLTPALSSPSGTVFPVGVNTVQVTATDALGQVSSRGFTVTVVPAPPAVTVVSATNQPGFAGAIALRWPVVARASAYSVKRASTPGGPYIVVSDRQPAADLDFSENGLVGSAYFYVVTSWLDDLEGAPSAEIPLNPALDTLQAAVVGTGLGASGVHGGGSRYLLTASGGNSGGGSDSITYAYMPWTGDGSFTVRVASLSAVGSNVSQFLNLGLSLRASTAGNAITFLSGYTTYPHESSFFQHARGATGQGAVSSAYGVPPTPNSLAAPVWLRAVRSGGTFSASFSTDGQTWLPTANPATIPGMPAATVVGVALGAQNATVTDAVFDQFVFLGSPVPVVQPAAIAINWSATPGLIFDVRRATSVGGPYQTLASGQTATSYIDTDVTPGASYYYTLATPGAPGGGATVSAPVAVYYPLPAAAPSGLTLTPAVGQITLAWTAGDPATAPTYTVERATSPDGPFTVLASGLVTATYTDSGFNNGAAYTYRVIAGNGRNTAASVTASGAALNGTFLKADNATALDVAGSWSPASRPGSGDILRWTGTYATASAAAGSGGGLAVSGLQVAAPSRAIVIPAGTGSLNLGAGGIDLSTATQNLTVNPPVVLAADQSWTVNTGRTLTLTAGVGEGGGARALTLAGSGTVLLAQPFTHTGATSLSAATLSFDLAQSVRPFAGPFVATGGTLRVNQAGGTLVLDATAFPTGASSTLAALTGPSGAGFVFDPHASAILTTAINTAGLSFRQVGGTLRLTNNGGASNLRIEGGTFTALATDRFTLATAGQTFGLTAGTVNLTAATQFGFRFGGGGSASQTGAQNVVGQQSGGVLLAPSVTVGGTDTTAAKSPVYTLSGGSFTASGGMTLGADTAGAGSTAFNLSGDAVLRVTGTLSGAQAGARQIFAMSGGTLAAGALNATHLRSSDLAANGVFTQSGGTLAPGDVGTAGRTQLAGAYTLAAAATLDLDLGGTTQATAFQTGQYDYLTVSGATTLAGNLRVRLVGPFATLATAPLNTTTFTVLNSTGALTGAFANVAFGARLATAGEEGTFVVSQVGNTVRLGQYLNARDSWRLSHFLTSLATGDAADLADPDKDGAPNLLEYALGTTPTDPVSVAAPSISLLPSPGSNLQLTFTRARPDVTYVVEAASDLAAPLVWTAIATNPGVVGETVSVSDPVPLSSEFPRRFLRLRVSAP